MPRRLSSLLLLAMFALAFMTMGKTPRMPEVRGHAALEMALREASAKAGDSV
jgi:hypothetical protein